MKVVCKISNINSFSDINLLNRLNQYFHMPDGGIGLKVGENYTVYGILFRDNYPWYYLCEEARDEYPKPFPAEFFDIVDQHYSSYWRAVTVNIGKDSVLSLLVFDEWADDKNFYERLVDGDSKAAKLFAIYRELMNSENK